MTITINIHVDELPLKTAMKTIEKEIIKYAMEQAGFSQTRAAALLDMNRGTFRNKLHYYFPHTLNKGEENNE